MFEPTGDQDDQWGALGTMAGWSWRFLVSMTALVVVVFILIQLKFVVIPLLLAVLISSVLAPLTAWMERKGLARGLASTLTVVVAILVLVAFVLVAVPPFLKNLGAFEAAFENSGEHLYEWLNGSPFNLSDAQIQDIKLRIAEAAPQLQDALITGAKAAAPIAIQAVATFGLTIVLTGYLLQGGDRYWQWMLGFFAPVNRPAINELGVTAYSKLASYLQGMAIMAALYGVGVAFFAFLFGVKLALILGIVVLCLSLLPIIGAWTSGALVAAMAFVSGGVWTMVAMILVLLTLSQINSIFLRPRIVGDRVSLVPVVTLTTVLAGTAIA